MENRKRLIPLVVVIALLLAGYYLYANGLLPVGSPAASNTVSGFIEGEEIAVAPEIAGRIQEIDADEGDRVTAGEVVVRLDHSLLDAQMTQAQAALATAQSQLSQLTDPPRTGDLAAAKAAVAAAQQNYDKVRAGPTVDQLGQLKAALDATKAALAQAQAAYDRTGGTSNPFIIMAPQSLALQQATSNYNAAQAAFNDAASHPTAADLSAAESQVQQAQAALDRLTPTADSVKVAQNQVQQAQAAVGVLQTQQSKMTLASPVNGVVSARAMHAGEIAQVNSTILSITNLDSVKLTIYVPETQIGTIKLGEKIPVQVDSFPGRDFQGSVIFIDNEAEFTPRNVQTKDERVNTVFAVKLQLANPDGDLKPGMPADAILPAP